MNEIKVAMVGLGNIGKVHCLATLSIPILYPKLDYSVRFGKLLRNDRTSPCPYYFEGYAASLEEITQDPTVTIVDICSPNDQHFEQGMQVIASRKALYLEKPIGLYTEQANQLAISAQEADIVNQTAFMYRFMPGIVGIRDLIASGEIGELVDFKLRTLHSGYLNVNRPRNWKLSKHLSGGGPLLDIGVHMVDTVHFMLGMVQNVRCHQKTIINSRPDIATKKPVAIDVEDWAHAVLTMKNGVTGSIEVSRVSSVLDQSSTIEVYGTKGSLLFDSHDPSRLSIYRQGTGKQESGKAPVMSDFAKYLESIYPTLSQGWLIDAHTASLVNFFIETAAGKKLRDETPDFMACASAQRVIEACYRSAENGSENEEV